MDPGSTSVFQFPSPATCVDIVTNGIHAIWNAKRHEFDFQYIPPEKREPEVQPTATQRTSASIQGNSTTTLNSTLRQSLRLPRRSGSVKLQPKYPVDHELEELLTKRRELIEHMESIKKYNKTSSLDSIRFQVNNIKNKIKRRSALSSAPEPALSKLLKKPSIFSRMSYTLLGRKSKRHIYVEEMLKEFETDENANVAPRQSKNTITLAEAMKTHAPNPALVYTLYSFFFGGGDDKKPHVRFPTEIETQAAMMGDRAGKDREVKRAAYRPYRRRFRSKFDPKRNKKVVDLELGDDFVANEGCLHGCFEKVLYGSDAPDQETVKEGEFTSTYKKAIKEFATNVELGGEFIDGNLFTIKVAEAVFNFPQSESEVTKDLNYIAAQLWMFSCGIHDLFQADSQQIPTKSEFEKIMDNFGIIAQVTDIIIRKIEKYKRIHYIHSKEAMTALKSMGKLLPELKIEAINLKEPRQGKVLQINKTKRTSEQIKEAEQLKIVAWVKKRRGSESGIAASTSTATASKSQSQLSQQQWRRFNNYPKELRLNCLADLLENCSDSINRIATQVRFFVDDMSNARFEEEDINFLARVYLLDDLLKYFAHSKETTKEHRQNLVDVTSHFVADVQEMIKRGTRFLEKVYELNDMVQLCYDYMQAEYRVNLHTDLGAISELHSKRTIKSTPCLDYLCCNSNALGTKFHFKPDDFYKTCFSNVFKIEPLRLPMMELKLQATKERRKDSLGIRFAESRDTIGYGGIKFAKDREWTVENLQGLPKIGSRRISSIGSNTSMTCNTTIGIKTVTSTGSVIASPVVINLKSGSSELPQPILKRSTSAGSGSDVVASALGSLEDIPKPSITIDPTGAGPSTANATSPAPAPKVTKFAPDTHDHKPPESSEKKDESKSKTP